MHCRPVQSSAVQYSPAQFSAVQCSTVQSSAVQCSAVQSSAVQCSAVQFSAVQCSSVQSSAVQCSPVQCSAVQCSAVQFSAVQCSTVQSSAVQCSAVQSSAVQCSAVQFSAVQCSSVQSSAVQCSASPVPVPVQSSPSAVQCSAVQCSTVPYSTVPFSVKRLFPCSPESAPTLFFRCGGLLSSVPAHMRPQSALWSFAGLRGRCVSYCYHPSCRVPWSCRMCSSGLGSSCGCAATTPPRGLTEVRDRGGRVYRTGCSKKGERKACGCQLIAAVAKVPKGHLNGEGTEAARMSKAGRS